MTKKIDLCRECAEATGVLQQPESGVLSEQQELEAYLGVDTRYAIEAYGFVREAVARSMEKEVQASDTISHVSGSTLLDFIRRLAIEKFGAQAKARLADWGIFRTEDFGEIVFELIDVGLLMKSPEDSKEDFRKGFSFDEAFPEG